MMTLDLMKIGNIWEIQNHTVPLVNLIFNSYEKKI